MSASATQGGHKKCWCSSLATSHRWTERETDRLVAVRHGTPGLSLYIMAQCPVHIRPKIKYQQKDGKIKNKEKYIAIVDMNKKHWVSRSVINTIIRMWANAQRDGRPAEYRWRPVLNTAKFGSCPLLDCHAMLPIGERKTRRTQSEFCTWQNSVREQQPPKMYIVYQPR